MAVEAELYNKVHEKLSELGYPVFPYKNEKGGFPFIQLGETFRNLEVTNKTKNGGRVTQYVHVWHNDLSQVGTVTSIGDAVVEAMKSIHSTEHYQLRVAPLGVSASHTIDQSTTVKLRRYTIDVEYLYY